MVETIRWLITVVAAVTFGAAEVLLLRAALAPGPVAALPGRRYRSSGLDLLWTTLPGLVLVGVLVLSIAWGAFP